jgi:hypothetical protein
MGLRRLNKTPFVASRHFPQRGKILDGKIFPLWGKYRRSRGRGGIGKNKQGPHPTLSHRERAKNG